MATSELAIGLVLVLGAGCAAQEDKASQVGNYSLHCDATSTAADTNLHCLRHDTRSGEVVRVALQEIEVLSDSSPTPTTSERGRYQLECRSTSSHTRSDMFCFRLDTESGEVILVPLQKIPVYRGKEKQADKAAASPSPAP